MPVILMQIIFIINMLEKMKVKFNSTGETIASQKRIIFVTLLEFQIKIMKLVKSIMFVHNVEMLMLQMY